MLGCFTLSVEYFLPNILLIAALLFLFAKNSTTFFEPLVSSRLKRLNPIGRQS